MVNGIPEDFWLLTPGNGRIKRGPRTDPENLMIQMMVQIHLEYTVPLLIHRGKSTVMLGMVPGLLGDPSLTGSGVLNLNIMLTPKTHPRS